MKRLTLLIFITPQLLFSQHNWVKNRDWVVGEYQGYQVDSTARPNVKVPFNFTINYYKDADSVVSVFSTYNWMKVRNDSILVAYIDTVAWLNYWGRFHSDSTIEILYIQPFMTGGHRIYNWGKRVKSYVANEDVDKIVNIRLFPNPVKEKLNLSIPNQIEYLAIFNQQGQKVFYEMKITDKELDVSSLPNGIYWIQFYFHGNYISKQFIKVE